MFLLHGMLHRAKACWDTIFIEIILLLNTHQTQNILTKVLSREATHIMDVQFMMKANPFHQNRFQYLLVEEQQLFIVMILKYIILVDSWSVKIQQIGQHGAIHLVQERMLTYHQIILTPDQTLLLLKVLMT